MPTFSTVQHVHLEYAEIDALFSRPSNLDGKEESIKLMNRTSLSEEAQGVPGRFIEEVYVTFVGNVEYFVIDIIQPENVEDFHIIDTVTVSSNVWGHHEKFIRGSGFARSELRQRHNHDTGITSVYIPIFIDQDHKDRSNMAEFEIRAIQYIDGDRIRDVRFSPEADRVFHLNISNKDIQLINYHFDVFNHYSFNGLSIDENSVVFEVVNPDDAAILDVYINDQLISDIGNRINVLISTFLMHDTDGNPMDVDVYRITIDLEEIHIDTPDWIKIKIIYDRLDSIALKDEIIIFVTAYSAKLKQSPGLVIEKESDLRIATTDYISHLILNFKDNFTFPDNFIFENTSSVSLSSFTFDENEITLIELNPGINRYLFPINIKQVSMTNIVFSDNVHFQSGHQIFIDFEFVALIYNSRTEFWVTRSEQYYGHYENGRFIPNLDITNMIHSRFIFD